MFADDALGITGLKRRLSHRSVLRNKHRNERMPEYIVGETELFRKLGPPLLKIRDDDWKILKRVSLEPCRQIRLYRDPARLPDL